MKTRIQITSFFLMLFCMATLGNIEKSKRPDSSKEVVTVNTSADLLNLSKSLVNEYGKVNSGLKINLTAISLPASYNSEPGSLCILNENQLQALKGLQVWHTLIGRNVVVPVFNAKNPYITELLQQGISPEKLKAALQTPVTWGKLLGSQQNNPVHVYASNDQAVSSILSDWLSEKKSEVENIRSMDVKELIQTVENDPFAIGFCKLTQISQSENGEFLAGLKVLPFDKNENGKIDYMENFYENMQSFTRAVWIGKYPRELTSSVFAVSPEKPQNEAAVSFLKWIITNGQEQLANNGFSSLNYNEQLAQLAKLDEPQLYANLPVERANTLMSTLLLILFVLVLGGVCIELVFRAFAKKSKKEMNTIAETVKAFTEEIVSVPQGLYFDKSHSWAFRRKNGLVKVGIDDFLQHITGKITRIEMKEPGAKIRKGDQLCTLIRKGKVLHVYSPVTGTILDINEKLIQNPALLNSNPYSEGWIYTIEPVNWELELQYLQIAHRFKTGLKDEFKRLKDFMDMALKSVSPDFAYSVLQDGGSLVDYPLAELGPEVWDDFQTKFIDTEK